VWEITLAEAQAHVADCTAKLAQADVQLHERQALVDQLESQRIDLLQQRDRLHEQMERQRFDLNTLRAESIATKEYTRVTEDRAHQEVDHARQEVKALLLRLEQERREHARAIAERAAQEKELRATIRTAEHSAAEQSGRVAALEATLAQWRSMSEPVKQANTNAKPASKANSKRSRARVPRGHA
jgi:chromosome segregation ATPase